ncbi:S-layer homology domain-containing protein [Paenibacillus sp. N3/727]|uniref:S-layer homology domain-containing protein n=1 Tax=Paenibacillus sp. N3/727 TaxID=2925845 RepID=UPI001F5391A8|nr:S-layer homology domain-containing protein [Paenibacillus sp. N3/727]UNK18086.1 S-layer homology domain-containing protein [Paenibacillus sp. N3/727]
MSNTSYQFKENNQEMIQGGEKKVMKKILSVALSTAMAFSMFASVAFGDSAKLTSQEKFDVLKEAKIMTGYADGSAGLDKDMNRAEFAKVVANLMGLEPIKGQVSFKDKGYTEKYWATPYIEAVYAAGLMEGKNQTKKIFDYTGKVTVQEMSAVLVRALKLEVPANPNNNASDWAKGYVQAAIDAKIIEASVNPKANATRAQLVDTAYEIHIQQQKPKVVSYEVKESGKVVEFKLANNELVKVELETALKANTATEVKFQYNNYDYTESVTWVVTSATKVESATSSNLKEVEVVFDGKVDKASATDKNNYTVDSNSKKIKSVTLLEDGKTVRILLNSTSAGIFTQGTTYKVVVKNVKGENGSVLPQGEVSFASSDNTLPTVTEVKALGTKVIKVTFSEPIKTPTSSNFQLDEKAYVGNVTLGANEREVILRDYTGTISEGAHKLTTSLVEDFAGLKSLAATTEFSAKVDTEGPKVTEITATLEKVTVTFDEEIDPTSVTNESFYWKNGDSKKTGKATQIAANVYEVDFTENRLPGYETNLFVEVKDYSGNANAVKEHKVTASVDLVQPKLIDAAYNTEVANQLTVRFDKAVDAADIKYYSVKKGNDVIPVKNVTVAPGSDNKVFNVEFYSNLSGTYNLKVSGVQDKTALKNTMVTYEGTFLASDSAAPQLEAYGVDVNNSTRTVALTFDREIDLATLNNRANYYIGFLKNGTSQKQKISIPNDVQVNVNNTGKSVVLVFPQYIEGTSVSFPGSVEEINIAGLKSKTGQATGWIESGKLNEVSLAATSATQKDSRTIEVVFNKAIANANASDFTVAGTTVSTATISGNKVTLKTNSDVSTGSNIATVSNNSIQTYSGHKIGAVNITSVGQVAPKVDESALPSDKILRLVDGEVSIPFTTALVDGVDLEKDIASNLHVRRADKPSDSDALHAKVGYETRVEGNKVVVRFLDSNPNNVAYLINVKENATFIRNANDPTKTAGKSDVYRTTGNVTTPTGVTTTAATTTPGKVAAPGVKQVIELALAGTPAAGDLKVTFADGVNHETADVVVEATDDINAVAGKMVTALNTALTGKYTASNVGSVITFEANTAATNKDVAIFLTGGSVSGTPTTIIKGEAEVLATPQVAELTVTNGANRGGKNTVKFTDGTVTKEVTIDVVEGDTKAIVAGKIEDAFVGKLPGYTVTVSAEKVVFTANNAAANKEISITTSAN